MSTRRKRRFTTFMGLYGFMIVSFAGTLSTLVKVHDSISANRTHDVTRTHLTSMESPMDTSPPFLSPEPHQEQQRHHCALLFFGLPRSYESLVLPSIVEHVLKPNLEYACDVYAHAPCLEQEAPGRSGKGGIIDPNGIYLLQDAVHKTYNNTFASVYITTDSEQDFWNARNETIQKFRTTKSNTTNRLLYYPWAKPTYVYPTTMDNMVRQWHSLEAVWTLMQTVMKQRGIANYAQIAMLRSDVFYVTPIHMNPFSENNNTLTLPGFAMYPVNDRMVIGSYKSVEIWATRRFSRIDHHVRHTIPRPGFGMHSEHFLNASILPAIVKETNATISTDADICFWRVRADQSVWINDCEKQHLGPPLRLKRRKLLVETITGMKCSKETRLNRAVRHVACHKKENHGGEKQEE